MNLITVGEILKAQGIRGEIKVKTLTDNPDRFKKLKVVIIDGVEYKVLLCRVDGEFAYLGLSGIGDRNAAEELRGKFLYIDRAFAKDLSEGVYFIADILGCILISDDGKIGEVADISQYGSADVYTVKCCDGRIMRFPFLKVLEAEIDIGNKTITVNGERLSEVAVYED